MLLTGTPGSGKTTLIQRIHDCYKSKGLRVEGITTREVREGDRRIGFKITNIASGAEGWLAKVGDGIGPRVGKYTVVPEDLERIIAGAMKEPTGRAADLVLVDEIGPMEMTSMTFRDSIGKLLSHEAIVIATVKYGSHYPEIERAPGIAQAVRFEVSKNNREEILQRIISIVDSWMDRS